MARSWRLRRTMIEQAWTRSFAWRSDILFYRMYDILNPLVQILIWDAVFRTRTEFAGYTRGTMFSYVLVSTIFIALSRNWVTWNVGEDIRTGRLNQYLVKPVSYMTYTLWTGIGRTMLATLFALFFVAILGGFFWRSLFVPDPARLALAVLISVLAFFMNMYLSIAFGLVAFWIQSVEGFSAAMSEIRQFLSGGRFPLDIVGPGFVAAMNVLPFGYSGYVPAQVFLGKMSLAQSLVAVGVVAAWIVALRCVVGLLWRRGVRRYEAVGV